jgi:S-adenosylmethionine:tRNA ribosyltransferase-isomerase
VQARLLFTTDTGKPIEVFCLEPPDSGADVSEALGQREMVDWVCMVGGNRKWKRGVLEKSITIGDEEVKLQVARKDNLGGTFLIRFSWQPAQYSFADILDHAGVTPLPPYLNRKVEAEDKSRYQTIYAQMEGSVAAPTAGLHFTEEVMQELKQRKTGTSEVTLHVGAGTFKPVSVDKLKGHDMHHEYIDVSLETIAELTENLGGKIVPVGTTSLRTVESLYWMGVKVQAAGKLLSPAELEIDQWYPYDHKEGLPAAEEALGILAHNLRSQGISRLITRTQLMIAPGYGPVIASGLITNYHLPKSTLLVLVAALVGEDWRQVYEHALHNDYRFLSYGDSSLLWLE